MSELLPSELLHALAERAHRVFGTQHVVRNLGGPVSPGVGTADATIKLLVCTSSGSPRAVILCSASIAPGMVSRAMDRALKAKLELRDLGTPILDPLDQGYIGDRSYAILPYCRPLSASRIVNRFQRFSSIPILLDWLADIAARTVRPVSREGLETLFVLPLTNLATRAGVSERVRALAQVALTRLKTQRWIPKHVLMHGDLWEGNVLLRPRGNDVLAQTRPTRFVIIDWAGSEVAGYGVFDLVRLAASMGVRRARFAREVDRHCRILGCERADAAGHLLAAVAHIGINLEHFPLKRYSEMADSCLDQLDFALA